MALIGDDLIRKYLSLINHGGAKPPQNGLSKRDNFE